MFIGPSEEVLGQITETDVEFVPEVLGQPVFPEKKSERRREEKELQSSLIELARSLGYRVYHTHDSRRSEPGFPDLILVRDRRLVAIECKSATGKLSPEQIAWLRAFDGVSRVDAIVVRPGPSLDLIARFLS